MARIGIAIVVVAMVAGACSGFHVDQIVDECDKPDPPASCDSGGSGSGSGTGDGGGMEELIECDAQAACDVKCGGGGDCSVACAGADSCNVVCVVGTRDCAVDCAGALPCTIDCGGALDCIVDCPRGCEVANCTGDCFVTCSDGGPAIMEGTTAFCP